MLLCTQRWRTGLTCSLAMSGSGKSPSPAVPRWRSRTDASRWRSSAATHTRTSRSRQVAGGRARRSPERYMHAGFNFTCRLRCSRPRHIIFLTFRAPRKRGWSSEYRRQIVLGLPTPSNSVPAKCRVRRCGADSTVRSDLAARVAAAALPLPPAPPAAPLAATPPYCCSSSSSSRCPPSAAPAAAGPPTAAVDGGAPAAKMTSLRRANQKDGSREALALRTVVIVERKWPTAGTSTASRAGFY